MIQDIFPKKLHNEYQRNITPQYNDKVFIFEGSKLLSKIDEQNVVLFPEIKDFQNEHTFTYLFSIDEERYFLNQNPVTTPDGYDFIEVRELRKSCNGPLDRLLAAYTGKHLNDWYRDTQYCGRCGKKMIHSEQERAMTCPDCNYTAYPRIMPAVIVGIVNGDKILLTKYKSGYQHYALVAGFTEIGETAEETVSREVMEETGLEVQNIKYYKSQPWGIANDLLLGFFCEVKGSPEIRMDENELKFAEWVSREDIELQPDNFSLTNEMMKIWKDGSYSL